MAQTFNEDVLAQDGKVMVKFGASWCGPCKTLTPVLESVAEEGYPVYEVDIDQDQDATVKYGIRSVPTVMVFENGKAVKTVTGMQSKSALIELFS